LISFLDIFIALVSSSFDRKEKIQTKITHRGFHESISWYIVYLVFSKFLKGLTTLMGDLGFGIP
jgi:hypothetical protein